jgi:uncharacterized protein (DUF1800 family)
MDLSQIARNRFGLGPGPAELRPADLAGPVPALSPAASRKWIEDQFALYAPVPADAPALADRAAIVSELAVDQQMQREARQNGTLPAKPAAAPARLQATADAPAQPAGMRAMNRRGWLGMADATAPMAAAGGTAGSPPDPKPANPFRDQARRFVQAQHVAQVGWRVRSAVLSQTPFVDRMVHFWANHFAVSADKLATIGLAGLLEFEAVRPNVLGKFEDMLIAVETHPAMLLYLDQAQSIGPGSMIGSRAAARGRKVGLNENLAREIMELHTLGVRSGYTQADVTEFARALTGWTVAGLGRERPGGNLIGDAQPGEFIFVDTLHEPGRRTIVGKTYDQPGQAQARAVLADLAASPATAKHLATKLARHFIADDPPPALVSRLSRAWLASGGDLPTVYRALVEAPEAWRPVPAKFRDPWQWGVAAMRALASSGDRPGSGAQANDLLAKVPDRAMVGLFSELGQPVWRPGSPAGYDDLAASWAAPDALVRRVEAAGRLTQAAPATLDPRALAARLYGANLSPATAHAIAGADSPRQGLALLLVSPEMLRA